MEFRSCLFKLPPEIKSEVDSLIDKNKAGLAIYNALKERYGAVTRVPSLPTIIRYIKYYNLQKRNVQTQLVEERIAYKFEDGLKEIESILVQISNGKEPRFNKIHLLEGLVAKCLKRISEIELYPGQRTDKEVAIARYISEAKSIVESLTKLSKEVQNDEAVLIQLIRNESKGVLEVVREIVLEIAPDKYDLFKEKLKLKMNEKGAVIDVEPTTTEDPQPLLETGTSEELKDTAEKISELIPENDNHVQSNETNNSNIQ